MAESPLAPLDKIVICEFCGGERYAFGPPYCCERAMIEEETRVRNMFKGFQNREEGRTA